MVNVGYGTKTAYLTLKCTHFCTHINKKPLRGYLRGFFCGISWDRTSDTRIFSPLLYRLSYDTALLRSANVAFFLFTGIFF